jgi:ankyrin repeat protein
MTETDRAGRIPLHYAALENDVALLRRLLAQGADPNARDRQGFTPLHFACQQGAVEAVRALIGAGALVDARDDRGTTPLLRAVLSARTCQGEIITLLREHGADPVARDDAGETPTSWARKIVNYDLARYFEDVAD